MIDDRTRDQSRALIADLDFDVGPAGQLLLPLALLVHKAEHVGYVAEGQLLVERLLARSMLHLGPTTSDHSGVSSGHSQACTI